MGFLKRFYSKRKRKYCFEYLEEEEVWKEIKIILEIIRLVFFKEVRGFGF